MACLVSSIGLTLFIGFLRFHLKCFLAFDLLPAVDNIRMTLTDSAEDKGEVKSLEFHVKISDSMM